MRLLVVGPKKSEIEQACNIAKLNGADIKHHQDIISAISSLLSGQGADIAIIDVSLNIKNFIDNLIKSRIHLPVIACGMGNDAKKAVEAIRAGAKEYITLPPDEALIAEIMTSITINQNKLIYKSTSMQEVINITKQIALSNASVLITGESGTGKEVITRHLHEISNRCKKPLISINCAAIPESLLESELFGYEKGAFTDALSTRIGKFEEANGGIIHLDEISEMDIRLQAKLLRVLQEQEIYRVGSNKKIQLNIRIIASSNKDLKKEISNGKFRQDLYFRLNVINIHLPPLRERKEDILICANYFIEKYCKENIIPLKSLSTNAENKLLNYYWPGNIRELENIMQRCVLLTQQQIITESDIIFDEIEQLSNFNYNPTHNYQNIETEFSFKTIDSAEKELIINTLDKCVGNRTKAANILGISIRTLRNKLKLYEEAENHQ